MLEEKEVVKIGKPWKYDSFHKTFEAADVLRNKLLRIWENDEKHKGMQVKVHFLSSRNQYVVKTRLHPNIELNKKKKNVKRTKKNKRTNEGRKFDSQTID